jgi:prepilin-type N-terminal cleavage/methylation domain-containing protein
MSALKQKGLTLIEMMIALILALLVSAAILTIFISNIKSSAENIKMIQLNQELRAVMNFMSDELKRHGYDSDADPSLMQTLFVSAGEDCVVYAYEDASAAVATLSRGFRLNASAIEWSDQNTTGCATASGNWRDLTSNNIQITAFNVDPANTASAATVTIQRLDVTVTGERQLNPGVASRTLRESIRIRNDDGT